MRFSRIVGNILFRHFLILVFLSVNCQFGLILLFNGVDAQQEITQTTSALSEARHSLAATSSGELVFFAGGYTSTGGVSDRVDIYDLTRGSWTTATLSLPRGDLAATSSQNLVFFAGGYDGINFYDQVDIYDTMSRSWRNATLSEARYSLAATSVGNLVLFGGGINFNGFSNIVDMYNLGNNRWTTAILSQSRPYLIATSVDNRYALFAGGQSGGNTPSNVVDIFDSLSGVWNTTTLSQARYNLAATSVGNLAFFGGGRTGNQPSKILDIFNSTSQTWSNTTLSQARYWLASTSIGEIVAFGGGLSDTTPSSVVDMFNATSNTWFNFTLSQPRRSLASTSAIYKIFFGGGYDGSQASKNVDIFEIPILRPPVTMTPSPSPASSGSLTQLPTAPVSIQPSSSQPPLVEITPSSDSNNIALSPSTDSNGLTMGAIIGIAVGGGSVLIAVALIIFFILILKRRRKSSIKQEKQTNSTQSDQTQDHSVTLTEPDVNYIALNGPTRRKSSQSESLTQSEFFAQSSYKHSQVAFNELTIEKEIGEGSYGKVCLGKWNKALVALKFCKKKGKMEEFMAEVKLMILLPPHPNVVHMFGVSVDGPQPVIILEYCVGGSLDKLLFDSNEKLSDEHKFRLVRGIAAGMYHLHKHNIVHRDLAARNILLTASGDPKISDFGMSRILEKADEGKTNSGVGPVCWMAPESISKRNYSKKSDVWTFGIVVYEIVAQCEPHKDKDVFDVGVKIRDEGLTPEIPEDCPEKLRELMQMCWKKEPDQRPNFETICAILEQ